MRGLISTLVVCWALGGTPASAQVEVDRTLQRVNGTSIMASDVRQARLLKLAPEVADTDQAILTMLENRLLELREVSRVIQVDPTPAAIAARRRAWEASWPAGTDLPALIARAGATDQIVDGWFRDDLRIAGYLDQRFGQQADAARAVRVADWIEILRRRANLSGRRP